MRSIVVEKTIICDELKSTPQKNKATLMKKIIAVACLLIDTKNLLLIQNHQFLGFDFISNFEGNEIYT
jgi:hypothetical protein